MTKLFSHAGVSRLNGTVKVRWANDAGRVKVLAKGGHKDIDIIEIREPMSKEAALEYLLRIDFDNGNKEIRAALEAEADKRGVKYVKAEAEADVITADEADAMARFAEGDDTALDNIIDITEEVAPTRDAQGRFLPKVAEDEVAAA